MKLRLVLSKLEGSKHANDHGLVVTLSFRKDDHLRVCRECRVLYRPIVCLQKEKEFTKRV